MTKQHSSHFVCCFQKIAFVSSIQLWYLDVRRSPTCGKYPTFVPGSHWEKWNISEKPTSSSCNWSHEVMKSLTTFQLLTRMQPITKSVVQAAPHILWKCCLFFCGAARVYIFKPNCGPSPMLPRRTSRLTYKHAVRTCVWKFPFRSKCIFAVISPVFSLRKGGRRKITKQPISISGM